MTRDAIIKILGQYGFDRKGQDFMRNGRMHVWLMNKEIMLSGNDSLLVLYIPYEHIRIEVWKNSICIKDVTTGSRMAFDWRDCQLKNDNEKEK